MKYLLTILILSISIQAFPKKGPLWISSKAGNVETVIAIDDSYSGEIEKTALIGRLCNYYLQNSENINIPVSIFYLHSNCREKSRDYKFLSYDKGKTILYSFSKPHNRKFNLLKNQGIVIRIISSDINPREILKLLEYGLTNKEDIQKRQTEISYGYWKWNSLDSAYLESQLNSYSFSSKIDCVLSGKFGIQTSIANINYSWINQRFTFDSNRENNADESLSLSNIYQIVSIDTTATLIFDTDSSFYYLDLNANKVFNKQILDHNMNCKKYTAIINESNIYIMTQDNDKIWRYNPGESMINPIDKPSDTIFRLLLDSRSDQLTKEIKIEISTRD